jgi:hypothetical protein
MKSAAVSIVSLLVSCIIVLVIELRGALPARLGAADRPAGRLWATALANSLTIKEGAR